MRERHIVDTTNIMHRGPSKTSKLHRIKLLRNLLLLITLHHRSSHSKTLRRSGKGCLGRSKHPRLASLVSVLK